MLTGASFGNIFIACNCEKIQIARIAPAYLYWIGTNSCYINNNKNKQNMDINEMKLGDILKISAMFNQNTNTKQGNLLDRYIGKYVICRTRNEGINAGEVVAIDDTGVILKDARRLHYHRPLDKSISWYEGVAISGISKDSKTGPAVEKVIIEDYSLTLCTESARLSIISAKTNEQA